MLIVAAVRAEVASLLPSDSAMTIRDWSPIPFGNHGSHLLVTGIGRANAAGAVAAALSRAIDHRSPFASVINLGVAGALPDTGLNLLDIIIAAESVFFEEGIALPTGPADVAALGFPLGDPPWAIANRMIPDPAALAAAATALGPSAKQGIIATVARCSGTDAAARAVVTQTGAVAEAMEGAAVLLASRRIDPRIPVLEIRVISNTAGDRPRQHWNLNAALTRLHRDVIAQFVD